MRLEGGATDLLLVDFERVAIGHLELQDRVSKFSFIRSALTPQRKTCGCSKGKLGEETYVVGRVGGLNSRAIKEEAHGIHRLALAVAKGRHELLELGGALNLEEDLVVVVRHLDVEVLGASGRHITAVVVRHGNYVLGACRVRCLAV